ncbi:MAG TPA: cytochrome c biogenesis protein CcsA [Gemmatimonadaceae bacterium]|nr:cytochrome c biogenesis protein CcsA [Gemmatimonadaceae bacterium]
MILIGELSLWIALLMAVWGAAVSFAAGIQRRGDLIASGERAAHAALFMLALASLGLWTALIARDFSLAHVAASTSANLPRVYTLAAFWAGPAGSLLLWSVILAACSAVAVRANRARNGAAKPFMTGTLAATLAFAVAALCLAENPYRRINWIPLDGQGMLPLLQQPGMTVHPPILYLGLATTAVPLALAVDALLRRGIDAGTLLTMRRWVIVSWLFLTAGILLGMWWVYAETGLPGSWTRDPIGSAALFPWAVNTVLLHSLGGRGARERLLHVNVLLVFLAFLFAMYGAFVAHGGIVSSAHSYARSPVRGWAGAFLVLAFAALGYLLTRLSTLKGVDGRSVPASPAPRASRLSLPVIYAGLAAIVVVLASQQLRRDYDVTLIPGQPRELRDPFGGAWRFTSQGVSQYGELNRAVVAGALDVARGSRSAGMIKAERRQYLNSRGEQTSGPWPETATLSSMTQDVQVTALEFGDDEQLRARIAFNPLVAWMWIGGLVVMLGGAMALLTTERSEA